MKKERIFLFLATLGLLPIALSYGASPQTSMDYLFAIDASSVNSTHIFRAVMGLYLALALFWFIGAQREALTLPALWSLTVFMLGLAAGRVLSLIIDGMPHPLLMVYLLLEIGFGVVGYILISRYQQSE
ncbi:DUF4345 domain-containing protein [Oceanicoccus sagamiensis]|uniref:DUF4345 domain-containing protein n=1 Tax=Oceanicoccus sagamiensis TaxID=716816 RepID=A0A1X9NCV4_9GAMM|nr:DUF4345 domain-containing protein [Oceanicoccus sagamiensis]ARN74252.1 hypothetical protein BST96_09045 [Oceanicoccus sagamiensis]